MSFPIYVPWNFHKMFMVEMPPLNQIIGLQSCRVYDSAFQISWWGNTASALTYAITMSFCIMRLMENVLKNFITLEGKVSQSTPLWCRWERLSGEWSDTHIITSLHNMVTIAVWPKSHHGQQPSEHNTFDPPISGWWQPFERLQDQQPTKVDWDAI